MNRQAKIYIAGHRGMVGSALVRRLKRAAMPICLPVPAGTTEKMNFFLTGPIIPIKQDDQFNR